MQIKAPSVEQVRQLPNLLTMNVPKDWEDLNGHVNVQHYLGVYNLTGPALFELMGIDENRFVVDRIGFFELEHHTWFLNEIMVGDAISAYMRFVGISAKRFHGLMYIVNDSRSVIASALEFVTSGADLKTRRSAELSLDVAAKVRDLIDEHRRLDWSPSLSGALKA